MIFFQVELKFNDPFFGIAYADYDRNSACQLAGKGSLSYKLELPLKGCGTRQVGVQNLINSLLLLSILIFFSIEGATPRVHEQHRREVPSSIGNGWR